MDNQFKEFELSIVKFVKELNNLLSQSALSKDWLIEELISLVGDYIVEYIRPTCEIQIDNKLINDIIDKTDLSVFGEKIDEYHARKYVKSIVKYYILIQRRKQELIVKDKQNFGVQLESIGLNIGFQNEASNRSFLPDGNLVVSIIGMLALTFMILASTKK